MVQRLQKLVSQLELLREKLSQEDVNQKLLRSLSPKWNTYAVVWRNKVDLDTMSIDDLYNNLKPWCHMMVLVDMTGVIRQRNDLIMHSWLSHLQVLTQREIAIRELRKKLEIVQKEKDGIQLNVDRFKNASKSLNKLIECQIDNCKKGLGYESYNAVLPPHTGKFMHSTPDLSFTGLDDFVNEPAVKNYKAKSSKKVSKVVRKNDDVPIIEE
uniref:Ribonuclease H-like domain-containing protein n=1 Tax=Tanacetum cinerariifolium TaxID=118510 RepID=A0A699K0G1_TANCI|nr:ribonuclease H-like domain-containing protein [Tanacetum cinerariifolium]